MFTQIAGRYDLANHLLSGGFDFLWRARASALVAGWQPRRLLDLATGSGDLALAIERACPEAEVTGADFCPALLEEAGRKGLRRRVVADAMAMPFADGEFCALTVGFGLRNMASYPGALAEMARVIRPGGHLLVLDFSLPTFAPLRGIYLAYLHHVLPRVAGWVTGQASAYEYLCDSIEQFPSGPAMCGLIEAAGFSEVRWEPLTCGIVSIYTATRSAGLMNKTQ